ncbi:MAG: restriction endonuclease subunit S [Prevotella sp.]|nr:restriction endonuclease subunit S [Prevotella sp.]
MKKGWEYKKLGDVATFARGLTYSKNDEVEQSNNIVLRSNNIDLIAGKLDFSELKYLKEDFVIPDDKRLQKGSLFICMSNGSKAHLGKVAYVDKDYGYAFGGFMGQITPKNIVDGLYLHYALSSPFYKDYIKSLSEGANINNLKFKDLSEFIINYPPLSEQQSIVDYLDSAFAKIDAMKANAEKALNEAKALFQASLKEMLEPKEDVKWRTIGDLFETYSGGTPTKSNKEYYEGGTIPWLRSGEVCQKDIKETEMFITEKGLKESSAKFYPENTVVVAMYGATAAQVGILRIKSTSNQAVCGILPQKDFLPEFVYYWFSSIEDKLAAQAQGGAQPNISQQKIKKVEIPIYSVTEQQSIVTTLDSLKSKVDHLQENYNKISQECDALKQAILRQVFE